MPDLLEQPNYARNHEATVDVMHLLGTGIGTFCGDGIVDQCHQSISREVNTPLIACRNSLGCQKLLHRPFLLFVDSGGTRRKHNRQHAPSARLQRSDHAADPRLLELPLLPESAALPFRFVRQ
jgi:hypothetical protein